MNPHTSPVNLALHMLFLHAHENQCTSRPSSFTSPWNVNGTAPPYARDAASLVVLRCGIAGGCRRQVSGDFVDAVKVRFVVHTVGLDLNGFCIAIL